MNRAEKRRQKKLAEKATRNSQRVPSLSPLLEQSAQTIEQSLSLASQHLIGGRSAQAKSIYQQILQSDPEQPVALHFLGVIAHQRGNNTLAVERITRALVIKPDYAEAHNNLGTVFKDLGRLEDAVASHQKSIAINPDNANAHFNFGNVLREMGRLDEAVECYNKTVAIKPDYVEAHCNLGIALQNLGNFDEAEAKYQSTLAIAPGFAKAHYNLGTLLQQIGRFDEAISSYDLSALDYSRINSLECLYALERYEDFYLNLDKFIETDSKSVHAAAISTFASHQLNRTNPYPFCKNPMDFVRVYDDLIGPDEDEFLQRLVYELKSRETIWEPNGKTTHNGYQFDRAAC
jgi:tetratricopeptide (TPR) repeat protein